jgi:hypothetical protein
MADWAGGEMPFMELVEQGQVDEAVDWLKEDLAVARDRVVRTARQ